MIALVFLCMAIAGGVALVLSLALIMLGVGHAHIDLSGGHSGDFGGHIGGHIAGHTGDAHTGCTHTGSGHSSEYSSLKLFTLQGIASFLFMMGISGMAFLTYGFPVILAILFSAAIGIGTMYLIAYIFRASEKLDMDGSVKIESAIGCFGVVYLPFKNMDVGSVQVNVDGYMGEYDAMSIDGSTLNVGDKIEVKEIYGNIVKVIKHN